jgi:hypothetical protein
MVPGRGREPCAIGRHGNRNDCPATRRSWPFRVRPRCCRCRSARRHRRASLVQPSVAALGLRAGLQRGRATGTRGLRAASTARFSSLTAGPSHRAPDVFSHGLNARGFQMIWASGFLAGLGVASVIVALHFRWFLDRAPIGQSGPVVRPNLSCSRINMGGQDYATEPLFRRTVPRLAR